MEAGVRVEFDIMKVLLACLCLVGLVLAENDSGELSVQELYERAYQLRSDLGASKEDINFAGKLLMKGIGVKRKDLEAPSSVPVNITNHRGILRELAKALERGQGVPRNNLLSLQFFHKAADLGDPEAHGEIGIRKSFGLHLESSLKGQDVVSFAKEDTPAALLHFTFGALGNDSASQMALGYRHMAGLGVPKNCPSAIAYYNTVAEKVIALARIPGTLPNIERVRLSLRAHQGFRKAREEQWLQFYQYSADLGDVEAQTAIGQLFNYGAYGVPKDHQQALHYFSQAAEAEDAGAMSHLGHMYANGLGVKQSNQTALDWFEKSAEKGNPNGHYGLGYMYLAGYGVPKNEKKAFKHFSKAAEVGHAEAQFHLGVMYLKGWYIKASPLKAMAFFSAAGHGGHLLAMYNLAMMQISGAGADPNCNSALQLLKQVAEKGPWCSVLQEGFDAFTKRDYTHALLSYLRAAQMGLELGQSNAAWMLEHDVVPGSVDSIRLALQLYKGSSDQETTGALLSIGDIYYYGRGIEKNWDQSAAVYMQAEKRKSARGAFNLGYMYQYGAGVPQDLHMARRFYDLSHEYNDDAYYAAKIAVLFLSLHSWWEGLRSIAPPFLHALGDSLFTLKHADSPHISPAWWSRTDRITVSPERPGTMEKVMAILDFDAVGDMFQEVFDMYKDDNVGELAETLVLGALVVVFLFMFRRRQNNRRGLQGANRNPARRAPQPPAAPPTNPVGPQPTGPVAPTPSANTSPPHSGEGQSPTQVEASPQATPSPSSAPAPVNPGDSDSARTSRASTSVPADENLGGGVATPERQQATPKTASEPDTGSSAAS